MNKRMLKAQSAMEYLMTYGWAILIIAVVLGALFSLGVFTPGIGLGNSCIAFSGYLCTSLIYAHAAGAGTITLTVGQSTGTNWANAIIMFAIQGTAMGTPAPAVTSAATQVINGGLVSGQSASVSLSSTATASTIGTTVAGALWACYITSAATTFTYTTLTGTCAQTGGSGTIYYTQIATLTAKAV